MPIIAKHENIEDENLKGDIEDVLSKADTAEVISVDEKVWEDNPPAPLNLPWAQRKFQGSPSQVLKNLQYLYNQGYTTYPRTENQQYGDDFDFATKILALGTASPFPVPNFKGEYNPTKGKKFDPAHPPITPTTNIPDFGDLDQWQKMTYIRVVRHFLSTLMDPAIKRKVWYTLDVDGFEFEVELYQITKMGYFEQYKDYKRLYNDKELDLEEGDIVNITNWDIKKKQTDPPDLWTSSDIIEKMEKENLGTSATRGSMIDKIKTRGYTNENDGLESTRLGNNVIDALVEYAPMITDPSFTAEMQKNLTKLRNGDKNYDDVVMDARERTANALIEMKKSEKEIGEGMAVDKKACPKCNGDLYLKSSKKGDFYGCSNYNDKNCKYTENV